MRVLTSGRKKRRRPMSRLEGARPANLEKLGLSRISRELAWFSSDWRFCFPWFSLESLVRIGSFQWVTGVLRGELFSRSSPGNPTNAGL
jgi:hypothetical protein